MTFKRIARLVPPVMLLALAQPAVAAPADADYAVGAQYDTTHVYVAPEEFDRFVASFIAAFGGSAGKQGVFQVTPTPSLTISQLVFTPAGTLSVFGFKTPVPYPFGAERTGYLVSDMDGAVASALHHGATQLVNAFPDPIGRDVVLQWPGGVNMQFYWHTAAPSYAPLATVPENRVYLTRDAANRFIARWVAFAHARVESDEPAAPGSELGQTGALIRRVRITSRYGRMLVLVSNGQLPWPYGRELTGYEVPDLAATLARGKAAGMELLVGAHDTGGRQSAIVRFPGGYIAEIHAAAP